VRGSWFARKLQFWGRVELEVVGLGLDLLKLDVLGFFCGGGLQVWLQFEF